MQFSHHKFNNYLHHHHRCRCCYCCYLHTLSINCTIFVSFMFFFFCVWLLLILTVCTLILDPAYISKCTTIQNGTHFMKICRDFPVCTCVVVYVSSQLCTKSHSKWWNRKNCIGNNNNNNDTKQKKMCVQFSFTHFCKIV